MKMKRWKQRNRKALKQNAWVNRYLWCSPNWHLIDRNGINVLVSTVKPEIGYLSYNKDAMGRKTDLTF
jgi:hypothetical protein